MFFYGLKLVLFRIKFIPFKIEAKTKNKKHYLYLTNIKNQSNFGDVFSNIILKKIDISNVRFYSNFGFNEDCYITAMTSGLINLGMCYVKSYIYNKKNVYKFDYFINPNFSQTSFMLASTCSIRFNLFSLLISLISTVLILINRSLKNGRKKTS